MLNSRLRRRGREQAALAPCAITGCQCTIGSAKPFVTGTIGAGRVDAWRPASVMGGLPCARATVYSHQHENRGEAHPLDAARHGMPVAGPHTSRL